MDSALVEMSDVSKKILGADDNVRREAENIFERMKTNQTVFFFTLTRLIQLGDSPTVRFFAAVMLRQNLMARFKEWDSVDPACQASICQELVSQFTAETTPVMRRKIADVIAALAARVLGNLSTEEAAQAWPALMPMTLGGMGYSDPSVQEASFDLLSKLAEYCPSLLVPHHQAIHAAIQASLLTSSPRTRVSGAKAAIQVYISTYDMPEASAAMKPFAELLTPILKQVVEVAYNSKDETTLEDICAAFQDVVRISPAFFRSCLEEVISIFSEIARQTQVFDPSLCRLSFTFLISLGTGAKFTIRKSPTYGPTILTLLFTYLRIVDHEVSWEQNDKSDTFLNEEDENEFHGYARSVIHQIATALGPKDMLTKVSGPASSLCSAGDWQSQLAGLTVFSELSEPCVKSMAKHAPALTKIVTSILSSPPGAVHPRVRFAAVNLFAQLATDQGRRFALLNVPMLALLLDHLDHTKYFPRIISWTCLSIVDFCASLSASNVEKYAEPLLERAVTLLNLNSLGISTNALSLISAIATTIEDKFARFYDNIMPGLTNILRTVAHNNPDSSARELRGKATECIGLIAGAVGRDVFGKDVDMIMQLLVPTGSIIERTADGLPSAHTRNENTLAAIQAIAGCIGSDFSRYLPSVIPPLLELAGTEDLFRQFDLTEDGEALPSNAAEIESLEKAGFMSMVVTIRGQGMRKACVNTTLMQEKTLACEILGQFAVDLKVSFIPYLKAAADILLPLCGYRKNPRVRTAAIGSVAALVDVAVAAYGQNDHETLRAFWDASLAAFCQAADCETVDGLSTILLAMGSALDVLPFSITQDQIETISSFVVVASMEAMNRKTARASTANEEAPDDDEDAAEAETAIENDNNILEAASVLCTSLVKNNCQVFMILFEKQVAPMYMSMLAQAGADDFARMTALISFADIIENGGASAQPYCEQMVPAFIANAASPGHQLRRGACFGLKATIQQMGASFANYARPSIEACVKAVQYRDENDVDDCEAATDNALATLGKILDQFGSQSPTPLPDLTRETEAQLRSLYISLLPRQFDEDEDDAIHARFGKWMASDPTYASNPAYRGKAKDIVVLSKIDETIASDETLALLTPFV